MLSGHDQNTQPQLKFDRHGVAFRRPAIVEV